MNLAPPSQVFPSNTYHFKFLLNQLKYVKGWAVDQYISAGFVILEKLNIRSQTLQ